jgi:type VI secretion system secreted protein VgrG
MLELADVHALVPKVLALLTRFTQATRLLRLTTPLGTDLLAECVRGEEGISQGYAFEVEVLSTDASIELKTLLGQPVLLQLLTTGADALRPFHGHVTRVAMNGSNGGFARYTLTIAPWTAFLAHGSDSRIFQDMTVCAILDAVFGAYQGQGKLAPAWRFDLADQSIYPVRSLCTQYQESDLAFVERLLHEEGLFYFFEHSGDPDSATLGSHTMVIADHNGAFVPNVQASVNFTQPGAVMKVDSIDRWRSETRWSTNAISLRSWDYRAVNDRPVSAAGSGAAPELHSRDTPGAYAYASREQGQRIATNQVQALEAARALHVAAGTVRTLSPGTTFVLHGQAQFDQAPHDDGRTFAVVRAVHLMHNNLSADLLGGVVKLLGQGGVAAAGDKEFKLHALLGVDDISLHAVGSAMGQRPMYRNRLDVLPLSVPYRSSGQDGHGHLLHPRPRVQGQQSAIVVGPAGAVIHTDRDHRIKVQFHWQRGAASHSRLNHAAADSHTGAPADDTAGTWVRVATPVAGANWGSNMLPRVGQEVLVDFLEGNIDRPVVIGSLYNGRGAQDAQYNQVSQGAGAATGNAPAWFPGESGAHAHPAALSGIKTQAMNASQRGGGAYNQLVFDDSVGQARVALQRHAKAHEGSAELNLGHLRHQTDNQRLATAGFGAELKTAHSAALRAGMGLLLSSHARTNATGGQLDTQEAQAQIEQSHQLQLDMATLAQQHNARLKDEPEAAKLAAVAQMLHSAGVVKSVGEGSSGSGGGHGATTAYSEPHIQLASPAGITATTAADVMFVAGNTGSITAGQDINFAAQGNLFATVKAGISLFTYGKASKADKPNQETGIRLHAASGKVSVQAQSDVVKVTADKAITVASVTKGVNIAAKEHVMLTAQGAYLKLEGGNIMIHGPGTMAFKASMKELAGPASCTFQAPLLPQSEGEPADQHFILKSHTGEPVPNRRYRAATGNKVIEGVTDAAGKSAILDGYIGQLARFELVDHTHDEHFIVRDPHGEPIAHMRYKIRAADGIEVTGETDEAGRTVLFASDKIEFVELLFEPEAFDADTGVG